MPDSCSGRPLRQAKLVRASLLPVCRIAALAEACAAPGSLESSPACASAPAAAAPTAPPPAAAAAAAAAFCFASSCSRAAQRQCEPAHLLPVCWPATLAEPSAVWLVDNHLRLCCRTRCCCPHCCGSGSSSRGSSGSSSSGSSSSSFLLRHRRLLRQQRQRQRHLWRQQLIHPARPRRPRSLTPTRARPLLPSSLPRHPSRRARRLSSPLPTASQRLTP